MSFTASALIVTWVAILLLALVVSGLVRQVHILSSGSARQQVGPRPGARAPEHTRLAGGQAGTLLVLFLSEGCRSCAEVLHETERLAPSLDQSGVRPRAVYRSAGESAPGVGSEARGSVPVLTEQAALFDGYAVPVTPFAVEIDDAGRVRRSAPVGSADGLREFAAAAAGRPLESSGPRNEVGRST